MLAAMEAARIAALLEPFLGGVPVSAQLTAQLQAYLDLLLRWNSRINLTAVRDPDRIVTRHFGESLFAARVLREAGTFAAPPIFPMTLADVGSGAGFPGIPIKLFMPEIHLTLIESQNKKATFLREAIRTLGVEGAEVVCDRAENWDHKVGIVTVRAVEKFDNSLPVAAAVVADGGTLCLLIGVDQAKRAQQALEPEWQFGPSVRIPQSGERVVLMGKLI